MGEDTGLLTTVDELSAVGAVEATTSNSDDLRVTVPAGFSSGLEAFDDGIGAVGAG